MFKMLPQPLFGVLVYRWLIFALAGLALLWVSVLIRDQLNIEWSVASVRAFVQRLGVWGPVAFIGILTFRFLFLVPTSLLLLAAGVLFGAVYGTLYAGIGVFLSGMLKYGFALIIGRDALLKQLPARAKDWVSSLATRNLSAVALGGLCAYPFMPKHVFQIAAILSGMGILSYSLAVLIGGFIQASIFAFLGETIVTRSGVVVASLVMIGALLLPLCFPASRRRLTASKKPKKSQVSI